MTNWIAAVGILIAVWLLHYFLSRRGRFWRLIGNNPKIALTLFLTEPHVLVNRQPADPKNFSGPFRVLDEGGRVHTVFIEYAHLDEIQARLSRKINEINAFVTGRV